MGGVGRGHGLARRSGAIAGLTHRRHLSVNRRSSAEGLSVMSLSVSTGLTLLRRYIAAEGANGLARGRTGHVSPIVVDGLSVSDLLDGLDITDLLDGLSITDWLGVRLPDGLGVSPHGVGLAHLYRCGGGNGLVDHHGLRGATVGAGPGVPPHASVARVHAGLSALEAQRHHDAAHAAGDQDSCHDDSSSGGSAKTAGLNFVHNNKGIR